MAPPPIKYGSGISDLIPVNVSRNNKNDLDEIADENNFKLSEKSRVSSKKCLLTFWC
jgi:hypothetical protein